MATMMAYAAPQQYMWNIQATAPHNWSGPWPPGAPTAYPGPPPAPHGVDPNAWKAGQWTFNPMFASSAAVAAAGQAWAPHPMWGAAVHAAAAQAQQASDFNPYKRQPVPLSEEYKAQKLVANPLGLENMIPRSELEKQPGLSLPPTTPWLWTPRELEEDGRAKADARDRRNARERERTSSSHVSSASASASASSSANANANARQPQYQPPPPSGTQQQSRRSSVIQSSQYPVDPHSQRSYERLAHNSRSPDPSVPPASAPVSTTSFSSHYQQQQQQQQQQQAQQQSSHTRSHSHTRQPSSQRSSQHEQQQRSDLRQQQPYRQQTEPPVIPAPPPRTPVHVSSASAQARDSEQKRSEAFSSIEALRPTFSPAIVRTPGHYTGAPSASNSVNGTPSRRSFTDDLRDDRDPSRRLSREESISRSSPAPRDSLRRNGRDNSRSRYREREYERPRDDDSDLDSPVRPHFRGPIYGPPTPAPGASSRASTNGTSRSSASPTTMERLPSLTTSMSTLSVDTAPSSAASNDSNGFLGLTGFSDEPEAMLSPLMVGSTMPSTKSSPRDLSRSQTYPVIPLQSQRSNPSSASQQTSPAPPMSRTSSKTPRPSPSQPSSHIRSPTLVGRSRTYPSLANDPLAGEPPVIPPKPASVSRPPSPHRLSGRPPNPLPQPPMPIQFSTSGSSASASASASAAASQQSYSRSRTQSQYSSPPSYNRHSPSAAPQPSPSRYSPHSSASASVSTSSASAAASRHVHNSSASASPYSQQPYSQSQSRPTPQPPQQPRRVRHGYWNRRGDHLYFPSHSSKPFIVYAPRAVANPEDLAQYPSATDGFKNHRGEFIRYDPQVLELPESLPAHGEPPVRPYDSFIHHVTV